MPVFLHLAKIISTIPKWILLVQVYIGRYTKCSTNSLLPNFQFVFQIIKEKVKRNKRELSDYVKRMRELWLPSTLNSVRDIGSRETMGYVSQGAFSFTEAHACGVGYVAYNALDALLKSGLNQVLIRNTTSRTYRLANIQIIKNV